MSNPKKANHTPFTLKAAGRILTALETAETDDSSGLDRPEETVPVIPGYIIDRLLGAGAGGVTYLAHKQGANARVVIKILRANLGQGSGSKRAWRELDLLQQLRLPCLPRLLDYGTTDHSLFIVTEFIDGSPLDRLYPESNHAHSGKLRERVQLLERLARAAHLLHERGVIHRDLKPSNVIVAGDAQPFIIDLGIALIDAPDLHQTLTMDGTAIGTPAFMAPEQARGHHDEISTRSDIYSLGAIGYWLCTGQTPHDLSGATLHEAIRRVGTDPPRDPRAISETIPKALASVLTKTCAHKPTDRYASADELAADLHRWLAGQPVDATTPGPWRRCTRWAGHHPILTTSLACIVIAALSLAATFGVVRWMQQRPFHVIVDQDHARWARLVSVSGATLHTWRSNKNGGVKFIQIVDRPEQLGGGRVIVTAIHQPDALDASLDSQLCVWDADDPTRLLWSTKPTAPYIEAPPGSDTQLQTDWYSTGSVLITDVFPEHPGAEIVATHNHMYTPTAIRVYDLAGNVLFEIWHWGAAQQPYWLSGPGYLIFHGCDNTAPWPELGYPDVKFRWPIDVFAIKPVLGQKLGWMNGPAASPDAKPVWRKFLLPPSAKDRLSNFKIGVPGFQVYPASSMFGIQLYLIENHGGLVFTLDSHGTMMDDIVISDPYRSFQDTNPKPSWFHFEDSIPPPPDSP